MSYRVHQYDRWPFEIDIMDGDEVIVSVDALYCSSEQETLEDNRKGVGFRGKERALAVERNAEQLRLMTVMAAAPDLLSELHAAPELDESGNESFDEFAARYRDWYCGARMAAIAKAEGTTP
jgi:hypothetical protein